jgi:hypothetical protein
VSVEVVEERLKVAREAESTVAVIILGLKRR